jgi:hypothetical protein
MNRKAATRKIVAAFTTLTTKKENGVIMAKGTSLQHLGVFSGTVAKGARINFELPKRGTYNTLYLCFRDTNGALVTAAHMATDIGDIEISLNGDQKIKLPLVTLQNIFQHQGGGAPAGFLGINLYNLRFDSYAQRQDIGWGMADITSATIFVNVASPGTLYTVTIEVMADWDENRIQPLGAHQCYGYQDATFSGPGTFDNNTLNTFGVDAAMQAIHVQNGTPSNIYLETDGRNLVNNMPPEAFDIQNVAANYVVVSNLGTSIRFDNKNTLLGVLPMFNVSKLRYRATYASAVTAGSVRFIYEYVRGVDPAVFVK